MVGYGSMLMESFVRAQRKKSRTHCIFSRQGMKHQIAALSARNPKLLYSVTDLTKQMKQKSQA